MGGKKPSTAAKRCHEAWGTLSVGDEITTKEFSELVGMPTKPTDRAQTIKAVSSFLRNKTLTGNATVDKKNTRRYKYVVKSTKQLPRRSRKGMPLGKRKTKALSIEDYKFDMLELGQAVMTFINDLKQEIRRKDGTIREIIEDHRQALKEKTQIEGLYRDAQEKILELSKKVTKGGNKMSLHDLQEHVGKFPAQREA